MARHVERGAVGTISFTYPPRHGARSVRVRLRIRQGPPQSWRPSRGVCLGSGLVITAGHVVGFDRSHRVRIARPARARALAQDTGKAARGRSLDVVNFGMRCCRNSARGCGSMASRVIHGPCFSACSRRRAVRSIPAHHPCIRQRFFPIAAVRPAGLARPRFGPTAQARQPRTFMTRGD